MTVQELIADLSQYGPTMPVLVEMSALMSGIKCDECGVSVPVDQDALLRPVGTRKLFSNRLTVFIQTEEA